MGFAKEVADRFLFFDADEIKDYRALLRFLADPNSELRTAALLRSRLVRVTDAALATMAASPSAARRMPSARWLRQLLPVQRIRMSLVEGVMRGQMIKPSTLITQPPTGAQSTRTHRCRAGVWGWV